MATYAKSEVAPNLNKKITVYNTSDWHAGSLAFHDRALKKLLKMIDKPNTFWTFGGDAIEGKKIDSPHFNPEGLDHKKLNIHDQCDYLIDLLQPVADKLLLFQRGNHELYLQKDFDVIKYICKGIGRPDAYGGYQAWVEFADILMHFWHGRATMPRGAKDPIQREANQKAWLKNRMQDLASAHVHYMGHTHKCMIVPPIEQYALMPHSKDVHGVYFTEQPTIINGDLWVPKDARWYVNTGTLRRGGQFGYEDYSEIAGYAPPPIACTKTTIYRGKIQDIEKIIF